jgi:hypothetical protein
LAAVSKRIFTGTSLAALAIALGITSCAPPPGGDVGNVVTGGLRSGDSALNRNEIDAILNAPQSPSQSTTAKPRTTRPAEERPGLATGYGPTMRSEWTRENFVRSSNSPAGTGVIYYNDRSGIDAMTGYKYRTDATQQIAGGLIEWSIKSGFGNPTVYQSGGRRFVVGKQGASYSIVLKNRAKSRLEVVLSVDGLDVIDGKPASFARRGHIIAPGATLEVKGWRTSPDTVARFQFSTVGGSYANLRHGETRNVGVIGAAVFTEKGVDPWTWMPAEIKTRETATPFATAP